MFLEKKARMESGTIEDSMAAVGNTTVIVYMLGSV